nr:hypothetical protein [Candidatus Sigynarchaeum springense]
MTFAAGDKIAIGRDDGRAAGLERRCKRRASIDAAAPGGPGTARGWRPGGGR